MRKKIKPTNEELVENPAQAPVGESTTASEQNVEVVNEDTITPSSESAITEQSLQETNEQASETPADVPADAQVQEQPAPKKKKKKEKVKDKRVRNVWVKQCIGTIIFSIFVCALTLIPYTFGSAQINLTFSFLPLVGTGEIMTVSPMVIDGLKLLLNLEQGLLDVFTLGLSYYIVIFYGIILFDIVASLALAIFRLNVLRIIFKVISIICGVVMILIAVLGIINIIGFTGTFIMGANPIDQLMPALETSGLLFILALIIFASFLSIKQFRWFGRRW